MRAHMFAAVVFCALAGLAAVTTASRAGPAEGRDFAEKVCSACHGVLAQDQTSPKVEAPTFSEIAAKPFWTRTSLMVWFQTPHETMPSLVLKPEDKENIVAYILSLRGDGETNSN